METQMTMDRQATGPCPMETAAAVQQVREQVNLIQRLMGEVMKDGEHYGTVPGCGEKKVLLKAGAEKISMVFRLKPRFEIQMREYAGAHREYEIRCILSDGTEGVGCCSTMEGKYRFRSENTGREVPSDYWKSRDKSLLGGEQYSTKKLDGKWMIMHRVEHDNPADYYNTCLKMGKKRAHVDAIITATAASDIFTQDLEENAPETAEAPPRQIQQPARKSQSEAKPAAAAAPAIAANADTGELCEQIVEVPGVPTIKDGKTNKGKPWKRWAYDSATAGCWLGTFDHNLGALIEEAAEQGVALRIDFERGEKGGNILQAVKAE